MSPDSKGEMNQEATVLGEEEEKERVVSISRARPSHAAKSVRKVPTSALRKHSLGTTALMGCSLRMNAEIRIVSEPLLGSIFSFKAGKGSLIYFEVFFFF